MSLGQASSRGDTGPAEPAWEEMCAEFGRTLGLDGPVPRPTLEAALADETYAGNLLESRRRPALLKQLIEAPPRSRSGGPQLSSFALARKAVVALTRWAGAGFPTVDDATWLQRKAACLDCPHREPAAAALGHCRLCGCPLARKIRMTSEACPCPDPSGNGLTRWGEPAMPSA